MFLCWKLIRFVNIANTCSFLPAFLQREKTHSSKPKSLLRHLPSFALNSRKFLLQQFVPTYFHIYIEKLLDDTCVESVSWRCYQTIHYLRGHHVPIYQLKHVNPYINEWQPIGQCDELSVCGRCAPSMCSTLSNHFIWIESWSVFILFIIVSTKETFTSTLRLLNNCFSLIYIKYEKYKSET